MSANPRVVVIGGPNGAGKTTISRRVLRRAIQIEEFVNADAIAAGLSEYHPENVAVAAGRSLKNLFELYLPLAAEWEFLDNSQQTGETMIARGGTGLTTVVVQPELWMNLESTYGARNKG